MGNRELLQAQSGAYIARAKQKSGESIRLRTFDFLGFTFYCGRSRKGITK